MKKILIINSGSATLKFKIFSAEDLSEVLSGIVERIGLEQSFVEAKQAKSAGRQEKVKSFIHRNFPQGIKNHAEALTVALAELKQYLPDITAVGHRVVHGGEEFIEPLALNWGTVARLKKYNHLAPLHNPINIACIEKAMELLPEAKQMAVFDTAYYSSIPECAHRYALPEKYYKLGIRRYGFHGISHQYAAIVGAKQAKINLKKSKIITCHLGSGCSATATHSGQAVDTTMGFTPLEGLTMSTRAGDLDASIPLYMIDELNMTTKEINDLFNKQSGLLGLAGTMDMREILLAAGKHVVGYKSDKPYSAKQKADAKLALEIFIYDIVRYIGQLAMVMSGVDLIVFTGGIGERSPVVRNLILKKIRPLGKFKSVVVPANEELMIAKQIMKK